MEDLTLDELSQMMLAQSEAGASKALALVAEQHQETLPAVRAGVEAAEMHASYTGLLEKPLDSLVPKVPLGAIVVGGGLGLIVGDLIDGFVPATNLDGSVNFGNVATKGVVAYIAATMGGKIVSKQAGLAIAVVLGAQVLADVLPIDEWAARLRGVFGGASSGQGRGYSAVRQAESIARQNYRGGAASAQFDPLSEMRG